MTAVRVARDLHISGIVQGVGMRPFVYREAVHRGLAGWVLNASDGVHVHVEGDSCAVEGFLNDLTESAPAAARITSLAVTEGDVEGEKGFFIRESDGQDAANTLVSPDLATCPDCLRELFDARDRRFHYPFINCTNCGPRFTIIRALPYDRPHTSMAPFTMCATCDAEYRDPLDRRFHAQPDACFDCGPVLRLWQDGREPISAEGQGQAGSDALIARVAALLGEGRIVAIKGLGGYHLACDATNEEAVERLRQRKRRVAKPFALMVRDLAGARALCEVSTREAELLSGTVRPIVLLERKATGAGGAAGAGAGAGGAEDTAGVTGVTGGSGAGNGTTAEDSAKAARGGALAPSVAGGLHELGVMLPSTPLQHLLMAAVEVPLVMTSGNISEEPIIAKEAEAHKALGSVADAFLDNDREILSRYDDSVVRVIGSRSYPIRRARGLAPRPLPFPRAAAGERGGSYYRPGILATGPEQKSTFCLVRGGEAFCSQHLGDLENAPSFAAWLSTLALYERLFGLDYQVIACDMHPEYLSTKWANAQDEARIEVQHHHAHIASVLAEHRAEHDRATDGSPAGDIALIDRVIGLAFDGSGFGSDGTIWGGEVLIAGLEDFERFAHLRCVPLPGGRAAIDHPNRMAWSYLRALGLTEHPGAAALASRLGADRLLLLDQMIAGGINSPQTSSMGRLFDAASALAGICDTSGYEGQAAVELEAALYDAATGRPVVDAEGVDAAARYRFAIAEAGVDADADAAAGGGAAGHGAAGADAMAAAGHNAARRKAEHTPCVFDPTPLFIALLDDCAAHVAAPLIALRFHNAIARLMLELCDRARARCGLSTVALSGGVFMNRYLVTHAVPLLEGEGFTVLMNRSLPANDGCISYGQAAVAAARLAHLADEGILLGT